MKNLNALCTELKELTWYNEHTQAKVVIAEYFKLDKYIKIFKAIEEICNIEGCTPWELTDYRHRKSMDMMDAIKQEHGEEIYNKIYNSL